MSKFHTVIGLVFSVCNLIFLIAIVANTGTAAGGNGEEIEKVEPGTFFKFEVEDIVAVRADGQHVQILLRRHPRPNSCFKKCPRYIIRNKFSGNLVEVMESELEAIGDLK